MSAQRVIRSDGEGSVWGHVSSTLLLNISKELEMGYVPTMAEASQGTTIEISLGPDFGTQLP